MNTRARMLPACPEPSRQILEQRKGRIQRIGQLADTVFVYNMRYLDSVEDRVHQLLSNRLQDVYTLFGQVPDVLEDVWIDVALGEVERAKQVIAAVPKQHPFDLKYRRVERLDWETCSQVLAQAAKRAVLNAGLVRVETPRRQAPSLGAPVSRAGLIRRESG